MNKPIEPGCLAILIGIYPPDLGSCVQVISRAKPPFSTDESDTIWRISKAIRWRSGALPFIYKEAPFAPESCLMRIDDGEFPDEDEATEYLREPMETESLT